MANEREIVHSEAPYNAEPELATLRESHETPAAEFYVRSHGNVPEVEAQNFVLEVGGLVATPLRLTLADLARFPQRTVDATLQCAGNRRAEMDAVKPVTGDPWQPGAIGNASWTGVALADVLRAAGADTAAGLHVAFASLDEVEMEGSQLPLRRLDPGREGDRAGGAAGDRHERRDAEPEARLPAARRDPRLRRRAQPQMARRHHRAGATLGLPDPGGGLQAAAARYRGPREH